MPRADPMSRSGCDIPDLKYQGARETHVVPKVYAHVCLAVTTVGLGRRHMHQLGGAASVVGTARLPAEGAGSGA